MDPKVNRTIDNENQKIFNNEVKKLRKIYIRFCTLPYF